MVKIFLVILSIILFSSVILTVAGASESVVQEKRKSVNWQPIIGFNVPGVRAFIDSNSIITINSDKNGRYNSAEILMSYDTETKAKVGEKTLMIKGMVKSLIIECKSGISSQISDFFFKESMPTRASSPLGVLNYPPVTKESIIPIDPKSILHNYLCPSYI